MALSDLLLHLVQLFAPAFWLGLLLALAGRFLWPKRAAALSWRAQAAINVIAGSAVLLGGLLISGHDGRMLTYGALVLVCASSQWLGQRLWR